MKRTNRKLRLSAVTIRELTASTLADVAGGQPHVSMLSACPLSGCACPSTECSIPGTACLSCMMLCSAQGCGP